MKPISELRELLEEMWRSYVSQFKDEPADAWRAEVYKADLEIYRAILAALAERTEEKGGASEEERKRLTEILHSWWSTYEFSKLHKENYEKIRDLILGSRGGAVMEKFVEKWATKLNLVKSEAKEHKIFPYRHSRDFILAMLREAGVAGKEVDDD